MNSQQSGAKQSGRKRQSILEGVYEENLRTQSGRPAPRRAPRRAPQGEAEAPPSSGGAVRWGAVLLLVVFVVGSGAAYVTGGTSLLRGQVFPPAARRSAASAGASAGVAPADSLQGRAAPFALEAEAPALPLQDGDGRHSVAGLFGLKVKTIVIDPGHGGKKDGAVGPGGTKEKHVALDVAQRLKRRLEARYGYRILMTRTTDEHVSLRDRVRFANEHKADLFLSIHVNSLPVEDVNSVETYYYGPQASEKVRRLAERENRASGYTVAEFNALLDEVGHRLRREESKRLAASIQKSLYRNIKGMSPGLRDWGVRTAQFVVLLGVEAPSILAEIGVMSNPKEEKKLRRPAYRAKLARFLEEGVSQYLHPATARADTPPAP